MSKLTPAQAPINSTADVTAHSQVRPGRPTRRERKSVQQQVAVAAALELAVAEGTTGLTMRRLAEELDVDPTALYRLFRDKDELLLAVYDRTIELGLDELGVMDEQEPWQDALRRIADVVWTTYGRYPAITALTFARTSGGQAERRSIELLLSIFARSGLSREQTALYYRAFIDSALGLCGQAAALAILEPSVREKDDTTWARVYTQLPRESYPTARAHANELVDVSRRAIYDTVIEAVLAAAERAAASPTN